MQNDAILVRVIHSLLLLGLVSFSLFPLLHREMDGSQRDEALIEETGRKESDRGR